MRVIVTGSRDWTDRLAIGRELERVSMLATNQLIVVVHGSCGGADTLADEWASAMHRLYPRIVAQPERHPARWQEHGKAAGPRRNAEMVALGADLCLAFIGPCRKGDCCEPRPHGSHGTRDAVAQAEQAGIPVRRIMGTPGR